MTGRKGKKSIKQTIMSYDFQNLFCKRFQNLPFLHSEVSAKMLSGPVNPWMWIPCVPSLIKVNTINYVDNKIILKTSKASNARLTIS